MMTPEEAFITFGELVDPTDVPALVRAGRDVWSFGYGGDTLQADEFTTISDTDLWAFEGLGHDEAPDEPYGYDAVVASWGPFRVAPVKHPMKKEREPRIRRISGDVPHLAPGTPASRLQPPIVNDKPRPVSD